MRKQSQHTPDARAKIRRARLGTKHTPETKAKISVARIQRELEAAVYRTQN